MTKEIRITFKNHIVSLTWFFIYIYCTLILAFYFYQNGKSEGLFILYLFILPQLLPTIYIHLKYYLINKNDSLIFSNDGFEYKNNLSTNFFKSNEIEKVIIYKSANMDMYGIPIMTFENYYYVRIYLKKGDKIVITSLLDKKIEDRLKFLQNIIFERKKGFSFFPNW